MPTDDEMDDDSELLRQKKKRKDADQVSKLEDFLSKDSFTKADLYGEQLGKVPVKALKVSPAPSTTVPVPKKVKVKK